jgi:hypothetical protein
MIMRDIFTEIKGYVARARQMGDARFVEAPHQRNTQKESAKPKIEVPNKIIRLAMSVTFVQQMQNFSFHHVPSQPPG